MKQNHSNLMKSMHPIPSLFILALLALASLPSKAQVTETYSFTLNRIVPDGNAAGLNDVRPLPSAIGQISSVAVGLKVSGEFNGDLYAYLRHASGFTVLLNRPGKTTSA